MKSTFTIAICDILEFSNLVKNETLDTIINHHIEWFRKAIYHSIHKDNFPTDVPLLQDLRNQSSIGLAWYSDTLLFFTLKDTDDALRELIQCLAWLLFETMIEGYTRLRCGVSYGEAYIDTDNSIFIGQTIIDAYKLQEKQAWSGGALTSQAVKRIPKKF